MKVRNGHTAPDFKGISHSKIGFFKEIRTKIKELETLNLELARRHGKLEAIFNSLNDGVTILNQDLQIAYANEVQKTMFPGRALIGRECFKAYFNKKRACKNCPAIHTMGDRKSLHGEILIKTGDHSSRFYEWTTSPVRDPAGKVYEVILLMRDITERKEYEYKLMQADRMAAVGFLAAGVAHEINNPLTSIAGFSEGLLKRLGALEGFLDNKQLRSFQEYLNIISSEAYRCKEIIQNLQNFSRSASEEPEILPVEKLITETVSLCRQRAKDYNIKVTYVNLLTRGLDAVQGIESQLKHLFLNLLIRAFKSLEKGGELHLQSSNNGNQIRIALSDSSGQFDRGLNGFDLSCRTGLEHGGRDIDLSICYNIVQHHKGVIQFENAQHKGRALAIYLPASI
jgi:PAS domain S-box-containing protein